MSSITEGFKVWIVGTLVILFYVSICSLGSTMDVNILFPHAVIAAVLATMLWVIMTIENESKKADLEKHYVNPMKPRVMLSFAAEEDITQRHRLLELAQLPPQSLSCEPQPVQSSLRSHPETFTQVVALPLHQENL